MDHSRKLSKLTSSPPRISLLVGAWNEYGRGIIEGVWQYSQQHGPWLIEMQPNQSDENNEIPQGWTGDGIIATVHTPRLASKLKAFDIPVVNVSGTRHKQINFPRVTSDAREVVQLAITHLREKGLTNIAFCGEPNHPFIDFWTHAYQDLMQEVDQATTIYETSPTMRKNAGIEARQADRRRWIEELPKPVGIIGWATSLCRDLAMNCQQSGIHVPEEVAILSLETEDLLGKAIHPPQLPQNWTRCCREKRPPPLKLNWPHWESLRDSRPTSSLALTHKSNKPCATSETMLIMASMSATSSKWFLWLAVHWNVVFMTSSAEALPKKSDVPRSKRYEAYSPPPTSPSQTSPKPVDSTTSST